jgi:hypothetical protein
LAYPTKILAIKAIFSFFTDDFARRGEKQLGINPWQFTVQYVTGSHAVLFKGVYNNSIVQSV